MANKNNHLVLAYFPNADVAEGAANSLKQWDKDNKDVKLGAVAILTWDPDFDKVVAKEVGQRDAKKGALWGAGIGAAAGILTAGIALIPGLLIGAAAGGGAGALNHKGLGMTDADKIALEDNLRNGGAALGVMVDDFEITATEAELARLGGTSSTFTVEADTIEVIETVTEAQTRASAAIDTAVSEAGLAGGAVAGAIAAASGLDDAAVAKMEEIGVTSPAEIFERGATPAGRAALAKETGLDPETILNSIKRMDLMRIGGVGLKYAGLLLASGVDSVPELAQRNAGNLLDKLGEINGLESLVGELPSADAVAGWVAQAKDLPKMVTF
ncbi:MAG: DUF4332 domain-containing protein [Chloroflexota bacterium]